MLTDPALAVHKIDNNYFNLSSFNLGVSLASRSEGGGGGIGRSVFPFWEILRYSRRQRFHM